MNIIIEPSQRINKRYKAIITDKTGKIKNIHFGYKYGQTYIDHKDKLKRANYIKRHEALGEDWRQINAGSLSRFILWGDSTDINKNLKAYIKMFFNE